MKIKRSLAGFLLALCALSISAKVHPQDTALATSIDKETIKGVIKKALPGIRNCYEQGLLKDSTLEGLLKVRFDISPGGTVSKVFIVTGLEAEVDACVASQIARLLFSPPRRPITITYPFTFSAK